MPCPTWPRRSPGPLAALGATAAAVLLFIAPAARVARAADAAPPSDPATVRIDASKPGAPISRRLFGKFTEHLGRNIYHGMWAQTLRNPGFERWRFFGDEWERRERAHPEGCAAQWLPLAAGRGRFALVEDCAIPDQTAQSIAAEGGAEGAAAGVGIRQDDAFLPLHRESDYVLTLRCRGEGLQAGFAATVRDGARELARAAFAAPGKDWEPRSATFTIPRGTAARGAPLTFALELLGPGTLVVDLVEIFPLDALDGFDRDVVRLCREARLPLLRYPGGNFASGYHWRDGIGPRALRPMRRNPAWSVPEYNHVGTDEFLAFCRIVDCEPLICVNAGDGTPEEAAAWVEYANGPVTAPLGELRARNGHPEPYGVRLWEIGNELYGDWQIGHATASEYADRYLRFVRALRAVDPGLVFLANGNDAAWNRTVLERCGAEVRSLSVHPLIGGGTPPSADPEKTFLALLAYPTAFERDVRGQLAWAKARGLSPRIAVTELQIFTNRRELPSNSTLAEALWLGRFIHTAIRLGGDVEMITHSALVNHGGGLRKDREFVFAQPVQEAHVLYGTMSGVRPLPIEVTCATYAAREPNVHPVDDAPELDAVALLDGTGGELTLVAINVRPRASLQMDVEIGGAPATPIRARRVGGPSYMTASFFDRPDSVKLSAIDPPAPGVRRIELEPHSITEIVYRLESP